MSVKTTTARDLAQISSFSAVLGGICAKSLRALEASEGALEALASLSAEVHQQAASGEPGDVVGLLLALGRAEEALAPLLDFPAAAESNLNDLRVALGLAAQVEPA